jgi:hypothetical protein
MPSLELLDYRNAHTFSVECQNLLFRVALLEPFALQGLLNKVIFIDDTQTLLPQHASNIFLNAADGNKLMICTYEWLTNFYAMPLHQYIVGGVRHGVDVSAAPAALDSSSGGVPNTSNEEKVKKNESHDMGQDTQDYIPMVMAVLLEDASCSPAKPILDCFFLGQVVRLYGLAETELNEELAVVEQRTDDNRVIVRIPRHPSLYSVSPEKLIIVQVERT